MTNPYRPAALSPDEPVPLLAQDPNSTAMRTVLQVAALIATVVAIAVYYYVMLRRIPVAARVPLWPTLTVPVIVSILSAIGSRSLLIPPLTAIAGVASGSVVFGFMRSWPAAELPIAIGLGTFLAIPSFILCVRSRRRRKRALPALQHVAATNTNTSNASEHATESEPSGI